MDQRVIETVPGDTPTELIDQLLAYDGPPEHFLQMLLAIQCRLGPAQAAAILRLTPQGPSVASIHPPLQNDQAPPWLPVAMGAAGQVASQAKSMLVPLHREDALYGQKVGEHLALLPIRGGSGLRGVNAFLLAQDDPTHLEQIRQRLELTVNLLSLYEMRLTVQQRNQDLARLREAMEVLAAVNAQRRFKASAMALCNETTARWSAERVGLGWVSGQYVKLQALSHTEKFTRKVKLVQDVESAMEECVDQDTEIIHPAPPEADYVHRACEELSVRHGPNWICVLPLRSEGRVIGALSVERAADRPLTLMEVESLRLICELCTARLEDLREHDRWFGARLASGMRKSAGFLVGPKHTWVKLGVTAVAAFLLFTVFARGMYRVEAPFVIEPTLKRSISAPYTGMLAEAPALPGDTVQAGQTVLARLNTTELEDELLDAVSRHQAYLREADIALRDGKQGEASVARADAEAVAARIQLLQGRIERANLTAPIDGRVLKGDWTRQVGKEVQVGEELYEVASLAELKAVLHVTEGQIADVQVGQTGKLASASHPGVYVRFEVERIDPMAEVVDQKNVFKVRVRLTLGGAESPPLKPSVTGLAKIDVEKRRYVEIWTRKLVNWLRMKLWF